MRNATVVLPAVASALIVAIVVILLWMAGSASGERARFSSLEIAPKDADIFVALNTDPTSPQWLAVNDSLDAINAKDPIRRAIDQALAEVNLDFEDDILPVAGDEAFFSVPDIAQLEDGGGYVMGFRVRDKDKARNVFDSLRQRAEDDGDEFEVEGYEGVTIYYTAMPEPGGGVPDCEFDDDGGIFICDGVEMPPDPNVACMLDPLEAFLTTGDWPEPAVGCEPFWACPDYGVGPEGDDVIDDLDDDGVIDSCGEAMRVAEDWELRINLGEPDEDCIEEQESNSESVVPCYGPQLLEEPEFSGAVALFEDVLAVGASNDVVKEVIDVVQGREPSAKENERLQEFRAIQKDEFLVWGYADLGGMWDALEEGLAAALESESTFATYESDDGASPLEPSPAPPPDIDFRVPYFDADYRIEDGKLQVTERITVDFGDTPKHGIYRDFETRIGYDFGRDESITYSTVSVTRDGAPEPFQETLAEDYHEVKFGDPNITITGEHTYEFQYTIAGGIRQRIWGSPDASYEFRWIATGDQWPVPIEESSVTFTSPGGTIESTDCFVGRGEFGIDDYMPCQDSHDGLTATFVPDAPIQPGAGLHFVVSVTGESGRPTPVFVPAEDTPPDIDSVEPDEPALPFDFSEEIIDEMRGTYDRVGFSISAAGDGYALDLTVLQAPGFEPKYAVEPTGPFDSHFAGSVPADTMFFFAGYDIYGQAKALEESLDQISPSDGSSGDDFLKGFTDATGLDLENDILSLLTGEYAVAGNVSGFEDDPPDFSIMALLDVNDAMKAQESLEAIGDYLEDEGLVHVDDSEAVQRWQSLDDTGVESVGITIDGGTLISGYPDTAVEEYRSGFDRSLADTDDWKRTFQLLPRDTTSIGFVSLARIFEELRGTQKEDSFNESTDGEVTLGDLSAIRSFAFGTTSRDNGFGMHFVIFMEDR